MPKLKKVIVLGENIQQLLECEDILQEAGLNPIFIQTKDNLNNLLNILEKEKFRQPKDGVVYLSPSTCLDFRLHEIRRRDLVFSLSSTELRILKALYSQLGSVYPTMDLIDTVWGDSHVGLDNLYVYIRRIRKK